jgi:hypothetical protein
LNELVMQALGASWRVWCTRVGAHQQHRAMQRAVACRELETHARRARRGLLHDGWQAWAHLTVRCCSQELALRCAVVRLFTQAKSQAFCSWRGSARTQVEAERRRLAEQGASAQRLQRLVVAQFASVAKQGFQARTRAWRRWVCFALGQRAVLQAAASRKLVV